MKNKISWLVTVLLGISALITGCGNQSLAHEGAYPASVSQSPPAEKTDSIYTSKEESEQKEASEKENSASTDESGQEAKAPYQDNETTEIDLAEEENSKMKIIVNVNGQDFTATLENNTAVDALIQMLEDGPMTLQLRDYAGFEKVGPLGESLPTSNSQITAHAGDIVLYQGNQIVIFYGSNSWSYTRLGRIDDLTGWEEALGSEDAAVILSIGK